MGRKIAVKRLTASDLTFFEWQFRNNNAGNQKAINLNADVFIEKLYPNIPELITSEDGRLSIDLFIYGPGLGVEYNLQRKIVKLPSYKNFRLNGEFVLNPVNEPNRFNVLIPEDIAIFEFLGDIRPAAAKLVLLAQSNEEDKNLHAAFNALLGTKKMVQLTATELTSIINTSKPKEEHPINELNLDIDLEDAALGGKTGTERLLRRPSGRRVSRRDLYRARENADRVGDCGEAFVSSFLRQLKTEGVITDYQQVSIDNAISPYDFELHVNESIILADAKSTEGEFERAFHVSMNELLQMANGGKQYDIYRVYDMTETTAHLRIARDIGEFARNVLDVISKLPNGVTPDGISIKPKVLKFEDKVYKLSLNTDEE